MPDMTDRDHFAAAALTGLLARGLLQSNLLATDAYKVADAMLRERAKTNHDAAPAARASVESVAPQPTTCGESDRTDKAAPRPSEGTGDTPDSPKPINGGVSDRSKPINGPDPDSRVWETPVHTPATHATRGEGSVRREGTEPFAWAIEVSEGVWSFTHMPHVAKRWPQEVFIPLYRQSQPTLTDAECDDLRVWLAECLRQASTATEGANEELAERWNERAKRAAAMIERQILNLRTLVDG